MAEENKGISNEDIQKIEAEVSKKQADALKLASEAQAKDIELRVRKDMESKLETDHLKDQVKRQEEDFKSKLAEQETKVKVQQEVFEKRLLELEAMRKGTSENKSPFTNNPNVKVVDGQEVDTTKLDLTEVEKQSAEAFRRHFGLPHFYFEKTGQAKR
jgi:hypothetical protein